MERGLPACPLRSAVDLGPGRLEACARSVCKQWLTDSQRVVKVDNGRSFVGGRHVFFLGEWKARNGLDFACGRRDQGQECHVYLGIGDAAKGLGDGGVPRVKRVEPSGYGMGLKVCSL